MYTWKRRDISYVRIIYKRRTHYVVNVWVISPTEDPKTWSGEVNLPLAIGRPLPFLGPLQTYFVSSCFLTKDLIYYKRPGTSGVCGRQDPKFRYQRWEFFVRVPTSRKPSVLFCLLGLLVFLSRTYPRQMSTGPLLCVVVVVCLFLGFWFWVFGRPRSLYDPEILSSESIESFPPLKRLMLTPVESTSGSRPTCRVRQHVGCFHLQHVRIKDRKGEETDVFS